MKIKSLLLLSLGLLGSVAFAGAPSGKAASTCCTAAPADDSLGATLSVGYETRHMFHDVGIGANWVSGELDWSLPVTNTVSLEVGANYGGSADDKDGSIQRLDLFAGLRTNLGPANLGLGYRWIDYLGEVNDFLGLEQGHEVGLTLGTSAGPVNIDLAGYYDFGIEGWYFSAGVNTEIKITDRFSLVPGASIGYVVDYNYHGLATGSLNGFTAVNLTLEAPIKLTKHASLVPFIGGRLAIDALKDAGLGDRLYGGAFIRVKF